MTVEKIQSWPAAISTKASHPHTLHTLHTLGRPGRLRESGSQLLGLARRESQQPSAVLEPRARSAPNFRFEGCDVDAGTTAVWFFK